MEKNYSEVLSKGVALQAILRRNKDEIRAEFLNYKFKLRIPYEDYKKFWIVDIVFAERAEILEPGKRKEIFPESLPYPLHIQRRVAYLLTYKADEKLLSILPLK